MSGADQTNAELVRTFFETLSTGDLERVRPLFHEDATWRVMAGGIPGAGTHVGRDVIVDEFLAPVRGMFVPGDPKVVIDNLIAEGPLVAVEARGQGRFADGREYNNQLRLRARARRRLDPLVARIPRQLLHQHARVARCGPL